MASTTLNTATVSVQETFALSPTARAVAQVRDFTTANFDFIQGYRPNTNVVNRPTKGVGRGYSLTGHHEIMIPLLAAMLVEADRGRP